jgi:hypothetical protein
MRYIKFKNGVVTRVLHNYWTIPRHFSGGNCATRILWNCKNLLVFRGLDENQMIGPLHYFGVVDPYRHPAVVVDESLPTPPSSSFNYQWISQTDVTSKNNLFPTAGRLVLENVETLDVPVVQQPQEYDWSRFKVRLAPSDRLTYDVSLEQTRMQVISYYFGKEYARYAVTEGDGLFLEEHPFIQSMTPLNAECGGYVMVGYRDDDDGSIHLSGIAIPYGYTLLIDSMALHGDATLVGLYGMEMTADHVEMAKADTVFLKKANGDRLALTEWPTGGGDKVISHPKFTSESSSFFLRRKILNPFF